MTEMAKITIPGISRGEVMQVGRFNEFAIKVTVSSIFADTSSSSGSVDA